MGPRSKALVCKAALVLLALSPPLFAANWAFAPELPAGMVDLTGWAIVIGEFDTAVARGAYRFYVNPAKAALYQMMRYRVDMRRSAPSRGDAERLVLFRHPGRREPAECWEKQAPGVRPVWRRVESGTAEYRLEMAVLMRVLAVHRRAHGLR